MIGRSPTLAGIVVIAGALLAPAPAGAVPSFGAPANVATGPAPAGALLIDVNGLQKLELVVANRGSVTGTGGLTIRRNTSPAGAGPVTFAAAQSLDTGPAPAGVAQGDFDGDLRPDLATANSGSASGAAGVSVLMNGGAYGVTTPTFGGPTNFAAGPGPAAVAAFDVNRDGKDDIVTANKGSASGTGGLSVLISRTPLEATTPDFAPPVSFDTGPAPAAVAVGELNRDFDSQGYARADLAVANSGSATGTNGVTVMLNSTPVGSATPSFTVANFDAGANPAGIALADVNNDTPTNVDVVTANSGSATGTDGVSVLLNQNPANGTPTASFDPPVNFDSGPAPVAVHAGDKLDFDSKYTDVITVNGGSATGTGGVSVLGNDSAEAGAPNLGTRTDLDTGPTPAAVAIADMTGDGWPELVTANGASADGLSGASVLLAAEPGLTDGHRGPQCTGGPGETQRSWSTTWAALNSPRVMHPQEYSTRVVARAPGGAVVFDQTAAEPRNSAQVTALLESARSALAGSTVSGPAVEASSRTTAAHTPIGTFHALGFQATRTVDLAIGPGTILAGRDQGQTLFVPSGCTNLNTHMDYLEFGTIARRAVQTTFATLALTGTAPASAGTPPSRPATPGLIVAGCLNADAARRGGVLGPAALGRGQAAQRSILKGGRLRSRRGVDRYCATGGGTYRIGYPTTRLTKGMKKALTRKVSGKVALVLTSSRRYSVAGARPGVSEKSIRSRLRGYARVKVGVNTWRAKPSGGVLLLVKVRGGRVGEVGIADARLGRGKAGLTRLLRAWQVG